MITLNSFENLSPIILTVLLIGYLIIVELGNKRTRNKKGITRTRRKNCKPIRKRKKPPNNIPTKKFK